MGIERLYADGIEQAYQRGLREPAAPVETGFRTGSFLAAGFGGLATGLLEQGASFLEGIGSYTAMGNQRFNEMGAKTTDPERAKEVQRGLDAAGRAARMRAQESAPDPQTTHMADQIFHGLTRFGGKAVGSVVAAGPLGGAALLGGEETNTIYRDLTMRGIDSETALKVAAVQGAISAAGVVLPISGAGMAATTAGKVGATAGLVAVGGPGAYVAQETLARDILQRAGYADEAGKHDPADPLGLAISTILPAAFGGAALRGALRTVKPIPPIKTEAGVRAAVQLTPEEQVASDAYERSAGNLAELRKEIARTKDPASRQILEAELATQTQAAAKAGQGVVAEAAARSPDIVDAARVKVLQETVQRSLPEAPDAYPQLMQAMDSLAAGERVQVVDLVRPEPLPSLADFIEAGKWKAAPMVRDVEGPNGFAGWLRRQGGLDIAEKFDITGDRSNVRNNPGGVFRRGGLPSDELASRAAEEGYMLPDQAGDTRAFVDLVQNMIAGERVLSLEQQNVAAAGALERQGNDARLADLEGRLRLLGEDPAAARGNPEAMEAYLAANERRLLASRVDEVADRPATDDSLEMDALRERAQQIAQDIRDTDRTLAQYEAELQPLSPVMRRLVQEDLNAPSATQAPYPEAAAPARGAGTDAPAAAADTGRPAADVQAAGVAKQERQIVEALAAERPDMMVTLPGSNEAVSLADALEQIKAQQVLDESDADLVRAAVLCDLSP
jgi:hypothetical protein